MCEIRFNMTDDELSVRIATYLANVHQLRNQLRNLSCLQFIDKAWFPSIRNNAFNQSHRCSCGSCCVRPLKQGRKPCNRLRKTCNVIKPFLKPRQSVWSNFFKRILKFFYKSAKFFIWSVRWYHHIYRSLIVIHLFFFILYFLSYPT